MFFLCLKFDSIQNFEAIKLIYFVVQFKSDPLNDSLDIKALEINQSFASSVFNESSLFSDMITSLNSHSMMTEGIPIKRAAAAEASNRYAVGSLVTANSQEDNMLDGDEIIDEKKASLDFMAQNQAEENFFAEFDDINFESINQMNLIRGKFFCCFREVPYFPKSVQCAISYTFV